MNDLLSDAQVEVHDELERMERLQFILEAPTAAEELKRLAEFDEWELTQPARPPPRSPPARPSAAGTSNSIADASATERLGTSAKQHHLAAERASLDASTPRALREHSQRGAHSFFERAPASERSRAWSASDMQRSWRSGAGPDAMQRTHAVIRAVLSARKNQASSSVAASASSSFRREGARLSSGGAAGRLPRAPFVVSVVPATPAKPIHVQSAEDARAGRELQRASQMRLAARREAASGTAAPSNSVQV